MIYSSLCLFFCLSLYTAKCIWSTWIEVKHTEHKHNRLTISFIVLLKPLVTINHTYLRSAFPYIYIMKLIVCGIPLSRSSLRQISNKKIGQTLGNIDKTDQLGIHSWIQGVDQQINLPEVDVDDTVDNWMCFVQ